VGHSDRVGNGMGNNRGSMDSVGNDGGSVDSMGNNRGGMHSVGNDGGGVDSVGNRDSLRVLGLTGVGNLSDVAINVVGVVVDGLDTAVGKVHLVGALNNTGAIVALGLAEGSLGVVVGNPIVVGVGGDLGQITGSIASNGGGVGNSVDHRGSMDNRGGVDNRGSVDGVGNHRGGVDSVVGNRVGNHRGGVDSMVGNRVGKSRGSVGNYWSGVSNSMGNWVSNMGSHGNNSSVSDGDWPVGSDGRLDLREALGVVSLSD